MSNQPPIDIEIADSSLKPRPRGLIVLGILNLTIFGIISLLGLGYVLLKGNNIIAPVMEQALKEQNIKIDFESPVIKQGIIVQMVLSGFYAISGLGLLMAKNWGKKFSLYLALFLCLLVVVSVAFSPNAISHAFIQIIYPAIMIFYLTNKNVNQFFIDRNKQNQ